VSLKRGDVFTVPIGDGRAGVGQVVAKYLRNAFLFAIFDYLVPSEEASLSATNGLRAPVLLLALSFDGKVHAGHWKVVGSAPIRSDIPLPAYKEAVSQQGRLDIVDVTGELRRPATDAEAARLPNRKIVAPVRLERALRAHAGLEPWLDAYDELRADRVISASDLLGRPGHASAPRSTGSPRMDRGSGEVPNRILGGPRTQNPEQLALCDLDAATIQQLERAGADLSQPRETLHYLYVGTHQDADRAKKMLARPGRSVETRPVASGSGWLVLLKTDMVARLEAIHGLRTEIEAAAAQVGGDYDGWEAAVPDATAGAAMPLR
jgi:hypothetical protein